MTRRSLVAETAAHGLAWLVAGNAAGLLLALLLLAPGAGVLLGPVTYGRLVPLHLDLQLYGWCSLPLVALLFHFFLGAREPGPLARVALLLWSAALAAGAASWAAGQTTGKVFLDWTGPAALLFFAAQLLLWVALAAAWGGALRARELSRGRAAGGALLLLALASVPFGLYLGTRQELYPPINPATGGPTGADLLGSTLGVVAIVVALPFLLGLSRRFPRRGETVGVVILLLVHSAVFALMDRHDHGHRELPQLLAVASLLVWPPLLYRFLSGFAWPQASARWARAFGLWGTGLVVSAVLQFLPGPLDAVKFSDLLVGHAHLAMACMSTSLLALVLTVLGEGSALASALDAPGAFLRWHWGCGLYLASMTLLGLFEAFDPGLAPRGGDPLPLAYLLRAVAGALMLSASVPWLLGALAACRRPAEVGALAAAEVSP